MSEIKILPCPFCGGEAKLCNGSNEIVGSQYLIRCKSLNCTVRPKTEWYETKEEAIRKWNTRKPMERIIEKLEDKKWGTSEWRDKWRDEIIGECIEVVKEEGGIE